MSYHPYRLQSIEDERRLLEQMLSLQDKVRVSRERERRLKSTQSSHYTKMFQPITNSLKKLQTAKPVVKVHTSTSTDEPDVKDEDEKYIKNESLDDIDESDEEKYIKNEPHDDSDESDDEKFQDDKKIKLNDVIVKNNPGELYKDALRSIPVKSRDDGVFGLDVATKHIGDYTFMVDDDNLHILDHRNQVRSYVIEDYDLWRLLLVKRPKDIGLKLKDARGRNSKTLDEYIQIVDDLNLVNIANEHGVKISNRAKYKLLPKVGRGFLFTSTKPKFLRDTPVSPSVVVVPSDKQGLLRELIKSVAELRSGNTSMQNVVVPLAQEAQRLRILPPGLLSPKEMSWVFA